ncbi:hypothetical protein N8264_07210 [Candidatus Thioglobus sp.]|nr:hypothetical protein [Candidatus Thioglobus sp.]
MYKKSFFLEQYRKIYSIVIKDYSNLNPKEQGKVSNLLHNNLMKSIAQIILDENQPFENLILNNYCYILSILESRHKISPYIDIEFSRRIGELWENFCKVSLNNPYSKILPYNPPKISSFYDHLSNDLITSEESQNINSESRLEKNNLFLLLKDLLGDIDLKLDYNGIDNNEEVLGIDFKSGFGSNEKGNTQRILQVGKIYKYIAPNIDLKLVVRQDENNNYLKKIEMSGVWDVIKGKDAYAFLTSISGCDINLFVENHVNFEDDMESEIYVDLGLKIKNRDRYLKWS